MRDRCWNCKQWEEHFYWEHMEETSFHFMNVMVGDFSQSMELPRKFAEKFRIDLLYVIALEAPNGKMWEVGLCKEQGQLSLKDGWKEFIEANGIEENYALVFKYDGNSSFNVQIFDQTGCIRVDETWRNSQRSQAGEVQICSSPRRVCHEYPLLHEISENDEKVGSYKIVKQDPPLLHSQSRSETKWSLDNSHDKQKMLQLAFSGKHDSSFVKIMKATYICRNPFMTVPGKFVSKHLRRRPDQIVLCDQSKKKWFMNCKWYGGAWGFFGKSLECFVLENNLEEGDACAFKLIKTSKEVLMDVHIVRAAEIASVFRKSNF